jgi:Family of unknown function (DUF5677)
LSLAQLSEKIRHASVSFERENHTSVGHIRKREGSALAFSDRLQAVIRVVLDEKRGLLPSRGWRAVVVSLIARTTVTLRAAHTLAAGHGREVPVVVRSALESLITATFIMKRDGARRAKRWAQYAVFLRGRFLERYPDVSSKAEHVVARGRILAQARRIARNFPNPHFWASGLGRGSLRHLATDTDMTWYYDFVYWLGSQGTHASALAVEKYVDATPAGSAIYRMGLSSEGLRSELAVCCDLLVHCLAALNGLCKLGLEGKLFDELIAEYKAAIGDEPLVDIIEAKRRSSTVQGIDSG